MKIIKEFKSTNKQGKYKFVKYKLQKKYNSNHYYINVISTKNITLMIIMLFIKSKNKYFWINMKLIYMNK